MQAFDRMHNVKRLPTGPHTLWPNRADIGVRLFKKFLSALVDTASKNLDQTTLSQITPAQMMRKAATVRNTQVTLCAKTPMELAIGMRPRDFMDSASMSPEQLISTPTKQDLLNEEIQKLSMVTHLEVQQREDIRRDLVERMEFVPPDLRVGESVFTGKKIRAKFSKDGNVENVRRWRLLLSKTHGGYQYWCVHCSSICKQTKETSGHCGSGRTSRFA